VSAVVVVGLGYVGLPLAMRAVAVGHAVVGYDVDPVRVKRLEAGESYVEDVPDDELAAALASGRFRPSGSADACADFDVAVITVPTPLREGLPDLSYVEAASRTLSRYLRRGATVIVESTSYPGTTQEQVLGWLEEGSGLAAGTGFHLGYSPERIDPGNRTWTLASTPKIVSGIDADSLAAVEGFYHGIVDRTVAVSSPREAEMAKLIENTFRHVNIALVNELAMFGRDLGVDVWEAIDAASTKPFGYMAFKPGPGVGGHCLPIDPSYLSWRVERSLGRRFRFVELANDINSHMPEYVVRRLLLALNERGRPVNGSRILLLGLAYKKNTGDARESPAIRVAELLLHMGADVRAADPLVTEPTVIGPAVARVEATPEEIAAADAVVLLTEHDAFASSDICQGARYVLDCRRILSGPNVETLLGEVVRIGAHVRMRSAVEQATHRLVIRRRLPSPFAAARIYVSSEGRLRYLGRRMAQVDPTLVRLAAEMVGPGDTVWDIGANLGLFSFAAAVAAGPSGRVLAVEPDIALARLLRRSAGLNQDHARVDVLPAAVSDGLGVARFHIARRNRSTNHLDGFGTSQTGGSRAIELVPTFTLDWLTEHFPAPDLIKIDVEEAEAAVLAGGSHVLGQASAIICEVAACNSAVVRETLNRHGYNLYDADRPTSERAPVSEAPPNTLAVREPARQAAGIVTHSV
jgi:UDP-N-acetyl-D-glucosamine dehydrogenase